MSPRQWLRVHRENARLRAQVAELLDVEHLLRLQLRIVRATRGVQAVRPREPRPLPIPMQRALDETTRRRRDEEFREQRSRPGRRDR